MKLIQAVLPIVAALVISAAPISADAQPQKMRMHGSPAKVAFPEGKDVVEVPFEFVHNKILIPVSVNGSEPMPFILDTGAPIAVLAHSDMADKLDLNITGQARVGGAGEGETKSVPIASDVRFNVAGIEITGSMMAIGVAEDIFSDLGFEGVIGAPIFKNLVVDFDFQNQILRLYPPESFEYKGKGEELPLTIAYGSFPYINTKVSIDGESPVEATLVIDTGAGHALSLTVDQHEEMNLPKKTVEGVLGWGANGVIHGKVGRISSLQLGDYKFQDVVTSFPNPGGMHALNMHGSESELIKHGILGAKVLKRFRVVFDYTNSRLFLEPNSEFSDPFRSNNIGLMSKPAGPGAESMEVVFVVDASPAQNAGIKVGDQITAINGKPLSGFSVDAIADIIAQKPGTEVSFTIRRGSDEMEKTLTSKELI